MSRHDRFGTRNTVARTLNDLGLATWFGGSLMGAVGLNGAAASADRPQQVARAGWRRWSVVNALAVTAYAAGALVVTKDNKGRILAQRGVAPTAAAKAALTGAALAATFYADVLGRRLAASEADGSVDDGARRRMAVVQWTVPLLTGGALVADSQLSEQQRPLQALGGVLERLNPAA
ncbi:hypothetical protein [Actinomarinicola tropica]|uniref:Uncharacterized protein n=1 Tax=Actinomarinicola tropica TaxID=2789776 RepID=A0A5Q2RLH2_9ACTN|nr:hypothetical protein [Actinomarinicola tropica]QGG94917.1 hypothetical protein GH723_07215 [Actinomarinicola tropica]